MTKETGGPAFPHGEIPPHPQSEDRTPQYPARGMTMRDWFATHAPEPEKEVIASEVMMDKVKNPHNDSHKPRLRDRVQIIADLKFEYADAMLKARNA